MFALMFALLLVGVSARSIDDGESQKSSFVGDLRYVYHMYEECNAKELVPCLKLKFISALDRLSRKAQVPILDGVSLVKEESESANEVDNEVLEATLPRSLDEKDRRLDEIILEKIVEFFSSRSVQFKLSGIRDLQRSLQGDNEDGRGKKNKYGSLMMLPLMMGGSMIPLALGTLALLAGKALIIAKLALTLSLIIGLKKLLSHEGQGSSYQVHGAGGHYRRSLENEAAASSLAYRAYIPLTPEASTIQYGES